MRNLCYIIFSFWSSVACYAQDRVIPISTSDFRSNEQIFLAPLDNWLFHQGNDDSWANADIDVSDWKLMKPTELDTSLEDETGRIEGWFRLSFIIDSSFSEIPLSLSRNLWAATDVYLDGKLVYAFGNTGNPYTAYNPILKYPIPIDLEVGKEHVLAVHVVDYETTFTQRELRLKSTNLQNFINLTGPGYSHWVEKDIKRSYWYGGLCIGIAALLFFLFWLLVVLNPKQKIFWLIAVMSTIVLLYAISFFYSYFYDISYEVEKIRFLIMITLQGFTVVYGLIILEWVLKNKISKISIIILIALISTSTFAHLFSISWPFGIAFTGMLGYLGYLLVRFRNKIKGAQLAVVASIVVPIIAMTVYISLHKYSLNLYNEYEKPIIALTILSAPFMLMIFISMRLKEVLKNVEDEAKKVMQVTEEKKELLSNQNIILEQQVKERTAALKTSLENLKATQSQLIQSEKMASLGELTAGIAHEIQNPLNFVNNFSEVSSELIAEIDEEMANGDMEEVKAILDDVKQNLEKINHHGKRADAIVKGMLQHSRKSTAEKEPTDINKLADEYLRLAYHGLRAKDKSFNATLETNFDESIGKINVIPQDMGRVILNLITNAFYATAERKKASENEDYKPTVSVTTKKLKNTVEIAVKDNGTGIPKSVVEKIFQPFFTTKPTGQGTGLGLSMSYDIIKTHGGELNVDTKEDEGTTFTIQLITNQNK
ncbi:ATP-binding protein [Jejudonia soesokkakensis]|uniref:histidine kinase n=1 Tax=Jejudonia soesokkakensis TaxID=1323432 RepID=A0ABW2MVT4_9FLAO